jgi:hypothetical protein
MATTPHLWKSQTQVNTSDAGKNRFDGQIIGLADGGYVVVWNDGSHVHNALGSAIASRKYNALSEKVGGEVQLSQFEDGDQLSPAINALPNGGVRSRS